ncbi:hypothetical protein DL93DRAFT_2076744 [Clavulina sp. PMI_390]|nr:hypothetical protein DL93DRAFT_2076744 [Clavulina sp. PMI_390]
MSFVSSSSQESLGFPPRPVPRRVLRAVESVDELDALGFAGIPRRHANTIRSSSFASSSTASLTLSSSTSSRSSTAFSSSLALPPPPPFPAPPTYVEEPSELDYLGFGGMRPRESSVEVDEVNMTTNGDVFKAKLRYKLHKLQRGKRALEWHVFLNQHLKPGEAPWAPLGSSLWKVPKYEMDYATRMATGSGSESESDGEYVVERRGSY